MCKIVKLDCNILFVVFCCCFFCVCVFSAYIRSQLSNRGLTNKLSMVVNVTVLKLLLSCVRTVHVTALFRNTGHDTNCNKKWKNKEYMKHENNVSLHSNSLKKKTFFSCTLKYDFNWTTAEQVEMGHHQWNGVLKMYRCMLWHLTVPDHWNSTN